MSLASFLVPQLSFKDGRLAEPTSVDGAEPKWETPSRALHYWHRLGVTHAVVNVEPSAQPHPVKGDGVSIIVNGDWHAGEDVSVWLDAGVRQIVVDHRAAWLPELIQDRRLQAWVRLHVRQGAFAAHPEADSEDLWQALDEVLAWKPQGLVVMSADRHEGWHHRSVDALAGICESVKLPVYAVSASDGLEELHKLHPLQPKGLTGVIVANGFRDYSFDEAITTLEARYDPYEWGPPRP